MRAAGVLEVFLLDLPFAVRWFLHLSLHVPKHNIRMITLSDHLAISQRRKRENNQDKVHK